MKTMIGIFSLILLISLNLFSCGKKENEELKTEKEEVFPSGFYMIDFKMINPGVSGFIKPTGMMWIKDDQFYIKIVMRDGEPKNRYQQYFHSNGSCPSILNDRNGDSIVDYYENFAVSGKVLFPLDKDISGHLSGNEWFPVTTKQGIYSYSRAVSVSKLVQQLRDPSFSGVLGRHEHLSPEDRVIIIYGTQSDPLLPVACGRIRKNRTLHLD